MSGTPLLTDSCAELERLGEMPAFEENCSFLILIPQESSLNPPGSSINAG